MSTWDNNNTACNTLWITLHDINQLTTNFASSGDLTMSELTFYNPLSSTEQRKQSATMIVSQLDNAFIDTYMSEYEEGVTTTSAINGLVSILMDGEKQVKDLGATCDELYKFITE
jgi:hypothetical protein